MAALENPRHELFAQGVVEGKSTDASYTDAGYKSQRQNASRLMANDDVKQRVAELQDHHQQRPDITVDGLTTQLEPSRALAMDAKQPAAATGAIMAMARLHGLDRGEGNVEVKVTQTQVEVSDLEVARRLAFLIAKGAHAADVLNDEVQRDELQAVLSAR